MTYKGFTVAAQERISNVLSVDDDGHIEGVVIRHDWEDSTYGFMVFEDEDCELLAEAGFETVVDAKAYIDARLEAA